MSCPWINTQKCKEQVFLAGFHRISYNITQETAPVTPAKSISRKLVSFWKVASKNTARGWGRCRTTMASFGLGAQNSNQIITDHATITTHPMRQLIVNFCMLSAHGMLKA